MVARFIGLGMLSTVAFLAVSLLLDIKKDAFFGLNPILAGFLTALITAALAEEVFKYIFFRLSLIKNKEVISWLDVTIAAIVVGIGFTLAEDFEFAIVGATNILRAFIPAHILFQAIMGYYYGKARVTGRRLYDVITLVFPILVHTFFDMFLIGLRAVVGDNPDALKDLSEEALLNMPGWEYVIPMLIGAILAVVIVLVGMILMLRRIGVWSKKGEKQERITGL